MKLISYLLDLLYPPKCAFCRELVAPEAHGICESCRKQLPFTSKGGLQHGNFFTACLSPLYYEEEVREALLRYKFHGVTAYQEPFSTLIAECVAEYGPEQVDFVSWVPLSRKRLRKRGYDQARLLAERTAEQLGLPCRRVLEKGVDTAPQSLTGSAEKRIANISGVYRVCSPEQVQGKTILLIDDIVTTGSTFSECARMLGMAGAERVYCAALARKRSE